MSCDGAGTVRFLQAGEVPALDGAGGAFTFACTHNVDLFADFKQISLEDVADVQCADIVETELSEHFLRGDVCLFEVTCFGLVRSGDFLVVEAELNGVITVVVHRLLLDDCARTELHNRNGNNVARVVEDLRHANFSADKTFFHDCFLLWLLVGPFANVTFW